MPRKFDLRDMTKGWFMGNFVPSAVKTAACEVAVKEVVAGERHAAHAHDRATEVTLVLEGTCVMGPHVLEAGQGLVVDPEEETDFCARTKGKILAVKFPSVPGDKREVAAT